MKQFISVLLTGCLTTTTAMAAGEADVYGIAHVSIDSLSGTTKDLQVNSRSSRIGLKGEKTFKAGLQGFYKFEIQYDMADDNNGDDFVKSRNMYVGIKDKQLGSILVGRHDTAMKKAIGIKIFSDTVAEMTSVMGKDVGLYNRTDNTIFYQSSMLGPIQLMASVSTLENDSGNKAFDVESVALTYKANNLYIALANEKVNAGQKGSRITAGYSFSDGHKIGIGYEDGKYASGASHKASIVNGVYKLSELYQVKASYGQRRAAKDETAYALGLVRDLGDKSELYAIYHVNKDDNTATDVKTLSLGMQYSF